MTIHDFIQREAIRMEYQGVPANPNAADWGKDARHYYVKFSFVGRGIVREFATYFSQGSAHKVGPKAADVLDCLASDAGVLNYSTFEEWADAIGMDSDSRKLERTYWACQDNARKLREFLGTNAFNELMNEIERL